MSKWLVLMILFAQNGEVRSYKPVVIIHGILDTAESMNDLKSMIEKAHPGTNVTVIKLYPEIRSLLIPMWVQIDGVSKVLKKIMAKAQDGVHLIGFSQGITFHSNNYGSHDNKREHFSLEDCTSSYKGVKTKNVNDSIQLQSHTSSFFTTASVCHIT